jgi:hypothetical protein
MNSVSDPDSMESVDLGMPHHEQLKQCCGSELVSMRIRFQLFISMRIRIRSHGPIIADLCGSAVPIRIRIQDNQINADPRGSGSTTLNKSEVCNTDILRAFEGRLYCTVPCRAEWPP